MFAITDGTPSLLSSRSLYEIQTEVSIFMKFYYVYILTNASTNCFYCGVTNNIERRMYEHKNKPIKGFTQKYNLTKLVFVQEFNDINDAIASEKKIKGKSRKYKVDLIRHFNPTWNDLLL